MGFYIRKALRVGPLRFNLSKSGIGVSAGIKGLRLGTGPRGNYVHMGRGGLYFRKSLGSPSRKRPLPSSEPQAPPSTPVDTTEALQEIDSGSVLEMVDASSSELLGELNEKRKKVRLLPVAITLSVILLVIAMVGGAPKWLVALLAAVSAILCWLVSAKDALRKTTVIFYDLEPEVEHAYQQLHDAFGQLRSCARIWHIEARGDVKERRYHAGAGTVVRRKQVNLRLGEPPFVKTNLEIPLIPVGTQTLAFMPDRVLVFDATGVGAVSYPDLDLEVAETQFIEEESVPQDATVIGKTWRYVNKNGGPDRRFKDNREIPICAYDQLHFSSSTGLNEVVQTSRRGVGTAFQTALRLMRELRTSEADATVV